MHAKRLKFLLNCYPPYIGAGVRIKSLQDDFKRMEVEMKLRWYNRNAVGSHFGGSLYSMVDPHIMLMLMQILGRSYYVWDKSASIEYVKASRSHVFSEIVIMDEQIADIVAMTESGDKYLPKFTVEVKDSNNELVAQIVKELYIRRKPEHR